MTVRPIAYLVIAMETSWQEAQAVLETFKIVAMDLSGTYIAVNA